MKRLYSAASIALTTLLLVAQSPADALGSRSKGAERKPSALGRVIAVQAKTVAVSMGSVGYCYRGVKRALKKVGVGLHGSAAYMAKAQLEDDSRFHRVPMTSLAPGDILVHGKSAAHPHGHIAVYLGNGKEASDHVGRLVTGARYGGTTVFRAKGATTKIASAKQTKSAARIIASAPQKKSTVRLIAVAPKARQAAPQVVSAKEQQQLVDRAVSVARARLQQQADQRAAALAHAVRVAKPTPPKQPNIDLVSALTRILPIAQAAHVNLTAALTNTLHPLG